jgi:methanol metabolism-related c-type cytochrome
MTSTKTLRLFPFAALLASLALSPLTPAAAQSSESSGGTASPAQNQQTAQNQTTAGSATSPDPERPYIVKDGRVDFHTFNGYRRYGDNCLRCHGPDGLGSSYAPNLTDSLKHMTKEQFEEVVINGRKNVTTATENVMPAFGTVPDVVENLDDIYAYLKARSDGVVGRGRPKRLDGED